jgi:hypothetical protein
MADDTPRVVLFGNTAPIDSRREVVALDECPYELEEVDAVNGGTVWTCAELQDASHPLRTLRVDQEKGLAFLHHKTPISTEGPNTVSVTRYVPADDMGLIEAAATAINVYGTDHSEGPPEWLYCEADPGLASAIADHFRRQGQDVQLGIPDPWENKRTLHAAGLRMILEAQGRLDELERPPMGGGSAGLDWLWDEQAIDGPWDAWARFRDARLRTNAGADFQSRVMADTASTGTGSYAAANYMALSTDATAPALADTTLTGELVGSGLQRQQAAYAHTAGATTYTLTKTFTSSDGTARTINKIGIFNAASTGTLVFETAVPSPPVLVSGDSLTNTETVTM